MPAMARLRLGDVGGGSGGDEDGLGAGGVGDAAESSEVDGVELVGPVAAGVAAGVEEVGLIADVVDRDGHVLGDAVLEAEVPEGELGSAPGEVEVGEGDAAGGDQRARGVEDSCRSAGAATAAFWAGAAGIHEAACRAGRCWRGPWL